MWEELKMTDIFEFGSCSDCGKYHQVYPTRAPAHTQFVRLMMIFRARS